MAAVTKIIEKINTNFDRDFEENLPEICHVQKSADSTVKLLLGLCDNNRIEAVIIPFYKRHTICLSTQVGCAMGCRFCETGSQGFTRNLDAMEILGQYIVCYKWICDNNPEKDIPKPNVVFMGEGEPLNNFDMVKEACRMLLSPLGVCIGPRQITLSTVGYLPGLQRIKELPGINFALSLHSAFPEKRQEIIPHEKKSGLDKILPLIKEIPLKKNQFINFEYLLIADFNDQEEDAIALAELVNQFQAIVNIIPYNEIPGKKWKRPNEKQIEKFKEILVKKDVNTMVRISKGSDIQAACGQLKGSVSAGIK